MPGPTWSNPRAPFAPVRLQVAREPLFLQDWAEQTHTRRIPVTLPNDTIVYEFRTYAFSGENASGGTVHHGRNKLQHGQTPVYRRE